MDTSKNIWKDDKLTKFMIFIARGTPVARRGKLISAGARGLYPFRRGITSS